MTVGKPVYVPQWHYKPISDSITDPGRGNRPVDSTTHDEDRLGGITLEAIR